MSAYPDHHAATSALGDLCTLTITHIEKCLADQLEADKANAKKWEEEERERVYQEGLAAEQAEREKVERAKKLEEEHILIAAAEKELALKKKHLQDVERASGVNKDMDDNDNEESVCSLSTIEQSGVSFESLVIYFAHSKEFCSPPKKLNRNKNGSRGKDYLK